MQDQRQYMRFNADGEVVITAEGQPPRRFACVLVDICFKGIGCMFNITADEALQEGLNVALELTTSLWDGALRGSGTIKYVRSMQRRGQTMFRIGIEFSEIDAKAVQGVLNRIQQQICAQSRKTQIG